MSETMHAAELVKQAIIEQWSYFFTGDDDLDPLWDESEILLLDRGDHTEVAWETGPYEWAPVFPPGGTRMGWRSGRGPVEVAGGLQAGEHFDAKTSYSVAVYR